MGPTDHDGTLVTSVLMLGELGEQEMVATCLRSFPEEGCGLLLGQGASGEVVRIFPAHNTAASSKLYVVDSKDFLRADRAAEEEGQEIIGVFHSHTHTDPYPSPTDVAEAPDPNWHYVIVSLRGEQPAIRSYRIIDGEITEEPIVRPSR